MDSRTVINTSKSTVMYLRKTASITNNGCNQTSTERALWGFFLALIIITSLLGNSVVIYTVLKKNQFRNRKFAFLLLLIISDFITAIVMMPLYFVNLFLETFFESSHHTCYLIAVIFTFIMVLSFLCSTLLALERYVMLKYPIKHRCWFTKSVATATILAVLLLAIVSSVIIPILRSSPAMYNDNMHICVFDLRGKNNFETHMDVIFQSVFLETLWVSVHIYCSVRVVVIIWKRRNFSTQIIPQVSAESSTNRCTTNRRTQPVNQHPREIRSTLRIIFVAFVALGCCLPPAIGYTCEMLGYHWSQQSLMATMFTFFCKSALNPLINAFFHTQLRRYLVQVLCCKFQI